jgi:large subunit ribosomal protein L27
VQIHVYPAEHDKAVAAVKKTHTTAPADGQTSRKERRRAQWTPRAQQREAAAAAVAAVALKTQP